jgi:hypothetical protein
MPGRAQWRNGIARQRDILSSEGKALWHEVM